MPRTKAWVQRLRWISLMRGFFGRPATDLLAKLRSNPRSLSYDINMCNNLAKKRRIFAQIAGLIFKGTYGNLPAGTQVGDSLVLIEDLSFPAILRPNQDEGNCLIGFAEVGHVGVMTGDVWRRLTKDGGGHIYAHLSHSPRPKTPRDVCNLFQSSDSKNGNGSS